MVSGDQGSKQSPVSENDNFHKCCMGLLYYSQAMQQKRQNPICVGFTQNHPALEDISEEQSDSSHLIGFKYVCMGYSIYECEQKRRKYEQLHAIDFKEANNENLPYCEGFEVISTLQGASQNAPVTMKEGMDGNISEQQTGASKPLKPPQSFSPVLNQSGDSNEMEIGNLPQKIFNKAQQVVQKMGSNLYLITNTSFKGLLKFLDEMNGRSKS